jgi:hypothetical protein
VACDALFTVFNASLMSGTSSSSERSIDKSITPCNKATQLTRRRCGEGTLLEALRCGEGTVQEALRHHYLKGR